MANWFHTTFRTNNNKIAEVVKNGRTRDFKYNENIGRGSCELAYGLYAFDTDLVEKIALENKSSFHFLSSDIMVDEEQEWEFVNGVETISEVRHGIRDNITPVNNVYYFYYHLNPEFPKEDVIVAISNKDYNKFVELREKWGDFYMPNVFYFNDTHIEIDEESFCAIDYAEYECG